MKLTRLLRTRFPGLSILSQQLSAGVLLLTAAAARADFTSGQSADRALSDDSRYPGDDATFDSPQGLAVDAQTKKVFVSDALRHRVLRFGSVESLQNGATAEAVLGQPDFTTFTEHDGAAGMKAPGGLAVDFAGRLWVADAGHNRVLRFDNAATLGSGAAASGVLGQQNMTSAVKITSATGMELPADVAATPDGVLWVADQRNNRVLRFNNAAAKPDGGAADAVLGQPDFSSGAGAANSTHFTLPSAVEAEFAFVNGQLVTVRLWVADWWNNRVVLFNSPNSKANGAAGDMVLGQPHFLSAAATTTSTGMNRPSGLAASGDRLWVSDGENERVLRFNSASLKGNGGAADGVLGQAGFTTSTFGSEPGQLQTPAALALDGTRLWIADSSNQRVLRHENAAAKPAAAAADSVLGDRGFDASNVASARWIADCTGMVIDPVSGKLFIADEAHHRVLRFATAAALTTNASAEAVLGQADFFASAPGCTQARLYYPWGLAMDHHGHLWVCDAENGRVLRFDNAASVASGSPAAQVLGQANFTSCGLAAPSNSNMAYPCGVAVEESYNAATGVWTTGRLWVSDASFSRVLRFDNVLALANGAAASGLLGQSAYSFLDKNWTSTRFELPRGLCVDLNGRLWVADDGNHRVLRFDNAAQKPMGGAANGVLLQPGFVAPAKGTTQSLGSSPSGLCVDSKGRLYVADLGNSRVVWFNNAATRANGAPADGFLGAPSWTDADRDLNGWNNLGWCSAVALDTTGRLWAGDEFPGRVLRFTPEPDNIAQWRLYQFGTSANSGTAANTADPDGDGSDNLMEYANGTNPLKQGGTKQFSLSTTGGQPTLTMGLLNPARSDVRIKVQLSSNLQPGWWFTMASRDGNGAWSGGWTPAPGLALLDTKFWTLTHTGASARSFYRLTVELLP